MTIDTIRTSLAPGTAEHRYERSPITGHKLRATKWHPRGEWIVYLRNGAGLTEIGSIHQDGPDVFAQPIAGLTVPRKRVANLAEGMVALDALLTEATNRFREREPNA